LFYFDLDKILPLLLFSLQIPLINVPRVRVHKRFTDGSRAFFISIVKDWIARAYDLDQKSRKPQGFPWHASSETIRRGNCHLAENPAWLFPSGPLFGHLILVSGDATLPDMPTLLRGPGFFLLDT
jgi:hypothetical protein